jgi:hypothetical protein
MRWVLAMALGFAVMPHASAGAKDCSCRYAKGDARLGETACIITAKGKSLARCEYGVEQHKLDGAESTV